MKHKIARYLRKWAERLEPTPPRFAVPPTYMGKEYDLTPLRRVIELTGDLSYDVAQEREARQMLGIAARSYIETNDECGPGGTCRTELQLLILAPKHGF